MIFSNIKQHFLPAAPTARNKYRKNM